jgi:hypothetical protein
MTTDQKRLKRLVLDRLVTKPKTLRLSMNDLQGIDGEYLCYLEDLAWRKQRCFLSFSGTDSGSTSDVLWHLKDAKNVDRDKWEEFLVNVTIIISRVERTGQKEDIQLTGTFSERFYVLRKIVEMLPDELDVTRRGVIYRTIQGSSSS